MLTRDSVLKHVCGVDGNLRVCMGMLKGLHLMENSNQMQDEASWKCE